MLPLLAAMVSCADVHACVDVDDDAFLFEDMLDPNSPLQRQHFCLETLRTYYRVLSSEDQPDL